MRLLLPACCQLDMALCSLLTAPCAGPDGPQGILPVDHASIFLEEPLEGRSSRMLEASNSLYLLGGRFRSTPICLRIPI